MAFLDELEVELFSVEVFSRRNIRNSIQPPILVREWLLKMAPDPVQTLSPRALIDVFDFVFNIFQCADDNTLNTLRWMVDEWKFDVVTLIGHFEDVPEWARRMAISRYENTPTLEVIRGPLSQRFVSKSSEFSAEEVSYVNISQTINYMANEYWDCSDFSNNTENFIECLSSLRDSRRGRFDSYLCYSYHENNSSSGQKVLCDSYVERYYLRAKGVQVENRKQILRWLFDEVGVDLPGVECFVATGGGQPHLLEWFCEHYCDIRDKVASQPGFMKYLSEQAWICSSRGASLQARLSVVRELSIVEAL